MTEHVFDTDSLTGLDVNRWVPTLNRIRDGVGKPLADFLSTHWRPIDAVVYLPIPKLMAVEMTFAYLNVLSPLEYKTRYQNSVPRGGAATYTMSVVALDAIDNMAHYVRHVGEMIIKRSESKF